MKKTLLKATVGLWELVAAILSALLIIAKAIHQFIDSNKK